MPLGSPAHCPGRFPHPKTPRATGASRPTWRTRQITRAPAPGGEWPDTQLLFRCPAGSSPNTGPDLSLRVSALQLSPVPGVRGPPLCKTAFITEQSAVQSRAERKQAWGYPETAELQEPCRPVAAAHELLRWFLLVELRSLWASGPAGPSLGAPLPPVLPDAVMVN